MLVCVRVSVAVDRIIAADMTQPSDQQILCPRFFVFFLKRLWGKHDVSTLKQRRSPALLRPQVGLPHFSTKPLHSFSLIIYGLKFLQQQQ